jgi:hypothetical protein
LDQPAAVRIQRRPTSAADAEKSRIVAATQTEKNGTDTGAGAAAVVGTGDETRTIADTEIAAAMRRGRDNDPLREATGSAVIAKRDDLEEDVAEAEAETAGIADMVTSGGSAADRGRLVREDVSAVRELEITYDMV